MGTLRFLLALSVAVGHSYAGEMLGQQVLAGQLFTPPASNRIVYFAVVIGFSALLFWLVVLPVDRYRRQFGARVPLKE